MQKTQAPFASAAQLDSAVEALKSLLGSRASTALVQREHHSHGETYHPPAMPDAVCYPHTTEEVSEIMKISAKYKVPVIPFGGGTSLEGHVNALYGGISIDLREMNKVLRVSAEDLDVTVEAGVTRQQLNKALDNTGLTFYVDPGGESTLGGMAATRASGTTTVRYGTMRDNVLALTVVMADGTIIKTGTRARKSSAGYDLTRLFVGSEGTLGIITNLTLRVHPLPEAVSAAVCSFPSVDSAVKTVIETIQFGASVARIELLDDAQMDAINKYSKTDYPVAPTLFFEFHGSSDRHVAEQAEFVQSIAEEHGAKGFQWATRLEDRDKLWEARHAAYYAAIALRPGSKGMATDACVPISRLAECIRETQEDNRNAPFPVALVGHVGDGNFHCVYVFDPENEAEIAEGERLAGRIATRALAMGGTCTGEHGIGYGKMKYLEAEHGPALEVMRTIKRALDPDNRMNPGKMVKV
ncbi:MAG: FAD-linked oxidase C-terminal domain-containing protein [Candidatus Korobacteraceae bacterium]